MSKNLTEYIKFLGWTKWFKKSRAKLDAGCQLCKMLHKKERHRISNIVDWHHSKSQTETKFSEKLLNKN
uniref:Uncharacterized protein n=1 Tax=Panagrolaimus sp. JU765 TaxID=591449 RepID=A0AC34QDK2_9BILA